MQINTNAPPYVLLMGREADNLSTALLAIENFEDTNVFKGLDPFDQHLLQAQAAAMSAYLRILLLRIERANSAAPPTPRAPLTVAQERNKKH
jgi:hypothetical protein